VLPLQRRQGAWEGLTALVAPTIPVVFSPAEVVHALIVACQQVLHHIKWYSPNMAREPAPPFEPSDIGELLELLRRNDGELRRLRSLREALSMAGVPEHVGRDAAAAGALKTVRVGRNLRTRLLDVYGWLDETIARGDDLSVLRSVRRSRWSSCLRGRRAKSPPSPTSKELTP
jgi:hypothetical protein